MLPTTVTIVVAFGLGYEAIQQILIHQPFIDTMTVHLFIGPVVLLLYSTVGAHLVFDFRSVLNFDDSGVVRDLQTAAVVCVLGVVFHLILDRPTSLDGVLFSVTAASEMWRYLFPYTILVAVAVATRYDWGDGVKTASVLTSATTVATFFTIYIEEAPIGYMSTLAYLMDPFSGMAVTMAAAMLNGVVLAAVVFALHEGKKRVSEKVTA